ncbi:MAG: spore coat protein [Eubacteriales bacterium]|nr:spore coat protein [Eubacteriales bacterium]
MSNPNQCAQIMSEKELLQDGLISQKQIAGSYNSFAGECVNEQLRGAFLNILDEEHRIQADIFCSLQSNGWYQVEPAEQQKIQQARKKYSGQP